MKIISNFNDYYDYLNDHNDNEHTWVRNKPNQFDERIVWVNPTTSAIFKNTELPCFLDNHIYWTKAHRSISVDLYLLLFCGVLYPMWSIDGCAWENKHLEPLYNFSTNNKKKLTGYDKNELYKVIEFISQNFHDKPDNLLFDYRWGVGQDINELFNKQYIQKYSNQLKQLHYEYNCPIILISAGYNENDKNRYNHKYYRNGRIRLTLNPNLSDYNFNKVLDGYNCYQTLDTFIFNELLNNEQNIPEISDKLKAESKGFDKWSFRKEPTK